MVTITQLTGPATGIEPKAQWSEARSLTAEPEWQLALFINGLSITVWKKKFTRWKKTKTTTTTPKNQDFKKNKASLWKQQYWQISRLNSIYFKSWTYIQLPNLISAVGVGGTKIPLLCQFPGGHWYEVAFIAWAFTKEITTAPTPYILPL